MENFKRLIVVLGPTGAGKSEMAVKLAKKFNGEIISADSRQVYKEMDIGTGKITPDTKNSLNFSTGQAKKKYIFTHKGIPHYCIDVASPKRRFTVTQYRKLALESIDKIFQKNKIPILCGGTGFYIQAVVDGILIPEVKPDWQLRKKLAKKSVKELFKLLKKLDPRRAKIIDKNNPRRLTRAIEIVLKTKKPVPAFKKKPLPYPVLIIGVRKNEDKLRKSINERVERMIEQGLEKEARKFPLPIIGYQEWSSPNPKDLIIRHTIQYAKRQMTWFKKDKRISWVKNYREAEKLAKQFLHPK